MKQVKIEFHQEPSYKEKENEKLCLLPWLAWTIRHKEAKHIYINEIFHKRLLIISETISNVSSEENAENKIEKETILLMIAFLIIHEIGHLLTRWSDQMKSPELFTNGSLNKPEAGYFLEKHLFNSIVRLVIEKRELNGTSNKWDENSRIKSISIRKIDKDVKLKRNYIHSVVTKYDILQDNEIFPLQFDQLEQINQTLEFALNVGDSDVKEIHDQDCTNNFADDEILLDARCGTVNQSCPAASNV